MNGQKIGKILIVASLILGTVIVCVVVGILFRLPIFRNISTLVFVIFAGLIIIMICGLLFGVYAFFATQRGDFNTAGMYALIGSALPPLDVVMAARAIFCFSAAKRQIKQAEWEPSPLSLRKCCKQESPVPRVPA